MEPYTFEERAFLIACAKFYQTETARVRELLAIEQKRTTDLLFKNNKLITKVMELEKRVDINKYSLTEKDIFD